MSSASPFAYMARTLVPPEPAAGAAAPRPAWLSRTDAMRRLLATAGRQGARELARAAGVESAMVSALLKADLRCGRVVRVRLTDGRIGYELAAEFDPGVREAIVDAIRLLKQHGFRVARPRFKETTPCEH